MFRGSARQRHVSKEGICLLPNWECRMSYQTSVMVFFIYRDRCALALRTLRLRKCLNRGVRTAAARPFRQVGRNSKGAKRLFAEDAADGPRTRTYPGRYRGGRKGTGAHRRFSCNMRGEISITIPCPFHPALKFYIKFSWYAEKTAIKFQEDSVE